MELAVFNITADALIYVSTAAIVCIVFAHDLISFFGDVYSISHSTGFILFPIKNFAGGNMSVYTIADLHLSEGTEHPMDVFGSRWSNYTEKICKNWNALVKDTDTVILPGDISWGLTPEESLADFTLLESLPGKKLLGKGNHDFWWATAAKLGRFFQEHELSSLSLLYNNALVVEDFIVAGTRGWFLDEEQQNTVGAVDFAKMIHREAQRLEISLTAARSLQSTNREKEILVFLHFPPVWKGYICRELVSLLESFGIKRCYFGHIHGVYQCPPSTQLGGIEYHLVSSDYLNFCPKRIFPLGIY